MKSLFKIILLLLVVSYCFSCKKQSNSGVALTTVDISLYANNPSFFNLNAIGGYVNITGGVRGILVYRKTSSDFMAYDRNCTYQSTQLCATVSVDATHILAGDSCCGSKYSIYDGTVTHGPATLPLKQYQTTWDGTTLHIFN